jgi:excisionase family DNA binding protein
MAKTNGRREQPVLLTVTVVEAGRMLGLSRELAYKAAADGSLPTVRFGRRRLVVPVARLAEIAGTTPADVRAQVKAMRR